MAQYPGPMSLAQARRLLGAACCPINAVFPTDHSTECLYINVCNCTNRFGAHPATHTHQPTCPRYTTPDEWYILQEDPMTDTFDAAPTTHEVGNTVFDLSDANPEAAAKIVEAIERLRPLDNEQKGNLLDILREDAGAVEMQVREAFAAAKAAKVAEVKAEFPEPESQEARFRIEAEQLLKAQRKAFRKLVKKAKKEGVNIRSVYDKTNYGEDYVLQTLTVQQDHDRSDYLDAVRDATAAIDRAQESAIVTIRKAREQADRKIRLAAVSKDAAEILGMLPSPEDMIAKVGEAIVEAQAQIEAGAPKRTLLGRRKS